MAFIPIRTKTIRGNKPLFFNLYLHIRDREVLYIKKNDPIEEERLQRLKEKKIKKVFIEADAEENYLKYLEDNLNRINDKSIALEERSSIIEGQAMCAVEDVFENPEKKETYEYSKNVVDKYVSFITENDKALGNLLNLETDDFDSYQHSLNVSSLSIGLALQKGITKKKDLDPLGMGALLHDIGKTKLNIDPKKEISTYSEEEMTELKKHPEVGAELMGRGEFVDRMVITYILQHEEHVNGTGYPKGLRGSQISPLTQFISLANTYDRYITFFKMTPKEAMKKITIEKVGLYNLDQIENLKKLLIEQGVYK
jgi:putative nucleotidyltransferase with HDIG domain